MVGLSLAAALGELPLEVAVIEPVAADAGEQPSFDSRTTALSSGSRRVLEGIGAWAALAGKATPIRRIHVSERGRFGTAVLDAGEQGLAEITRCIRCLRTGQWPPRLADVEEIDVIDTQLGHSQYVDEESRRAAMEGAKAIDEAHGTAA